MSTIRFRQFELECSIKCQDLSINDFRVWLNEKDYPIDLLMSYALNKCNFVYVNNTLFGLIDEISNYIYRKYKYGYSGTLLESIDIDTDSELDDLPELVDIEDDLLSLMTNLRNMEPRENLMTPENMEAALMNDVRSAVLFQEMMDRIKQDRLLHRKFKIDSIVEADATNCKEEMECCICFESYKREVFVSLNCKHEFCKSCLKNAIKSDKREDPCCAYCRDKISKMTSRTIEVQSELSELIL